MEEMPTKMLIRLGWGTFFFFLSEKKSFCFAFGERRHNVWIYALRIYSENEKILNMNSDSPDSPNIGLTNLHDKVKWANIVPTHKRTPEKTDTESLFMLQSCQLLNHRSNSSTECYFHLKKNCSACTNKINSSSWINVRENWWIRMLMWAYS